MQEVIVLVGLIRKIEYVGFIIQPYLCSLSDNPFLTPVERIHSLNIDTLGFIPAGGREIYELSHQLEPEQLIKQFSKKKNTIKDLFEAKAEFTNSVIQPYINKRLSELIEIIINYSIPLFDAVSMPHLYPAERIVVHPGKAQTTLKFERTEDKTIYRLEAFIDKKKINLTYKGNYILTNQPCYLVTEHKLVTFEKNITGKQLFPFLTKEFIEIPKRMENKYFSTFIKKIVNTSEIKATGFTIKNVSIDPSAVLFYEIDWQRKPCLVLKFIYGEKTILPTNPQKHFTDLQSDDNGFTFFKSSRHFAWEEEQKKLISSLGLTQYDNCFRVNEEEGATDPYVLVEWLIKNRTLLAGKGISIRQEPEKPFNLDEPEIIQEVSEANDWFDLNIVVTVNDLQIPFIKFRKYILQNQREYVLPDGSIFLIPAVWMDRYRQLMIHVNTEGSALRLKKHHYPLLKSLEFKQVDSFAETEESEIEIPELSDVTLRPYQINGFRWLKQLCDLGFGGILADDMGLGKTLQTIALLASYYEYEAPFEIAIPAHKVKLTDNGKQLDIFSQVPEIERTAVPNKPKIESKNCSILIMPASLIYNWANEINRFAPYLKVLIYTGSSRKKSKSLFRKYNVVLTTYGTVRNDIDFLKDYKFLFSILDESQHIKNPVSKTALAVSDINSTHRFVLTGTPVENSLNDLWSQMNFVNPGLLGSLQSFTSYYANPVSKEPESELSEKLLTMIQPFILRRTKESVAPELPEMMETVSYCTMTDEQNELYESEKSKVRNLVFEQLEQENAGSNPIMVLKALMQLRQIANHPRMVDPDSTIESGKFEEVTSKLETIIEENHKVLIFSSFVKHLNLIAEYCENSGYKYSLLTGSSVNRGKIVEEFKQNNEIRIFLISMKAGGVGLNLTEADYVFMLDPWWNPAAERQAVNRAHRIGQHQNVFVYRFITQNSIEEKILKLQEKKKALAETFIRPQEIISGWTKEELMRLFD